MKKNILKYVLTFSVSLLALTVCSSCSQKEKLKLFLPGEYIDDDSVDGVDLISKFEDLYNVNVEVNTFESNEAAYTKLQTEAYDVVIPSDYTLEQLMLEDKLQAIDWTKLENVGKTSFTNSLTDILADLKDQANGYDLLEYGVPYFYGSVGLLYKDDSFTSDDLTWDALKSSDKKIAFYDSSRDGFMVALKELGYSMNTSNEEELNEAFDWLKDLKSSVGSKLSFKTDELLDEMPMGNFDLTFMYSGDALYAKMLANEESLDLSFVKPSTGTNIFVDAMVIPSDAKNTDLAYKFIDFMSEKENAMANSEYVCYTTTIKEAYDELISADGAFYDYKNIYEVNYDSTLKVDEIFRYNKTNKIKINDLYTKFKNN